MIDWQSWLETRTHFDPSNAEAWRGIGCLLEWLEIRSIHEGSKLTVTSSLPNLDLDQLRADVDHSALLRRLLDKKEVFDRPPPLSFSYPWYRLIEQGRDEHCEVSNTVTSSILPTIFVNQHSWAVLKKISDTEYIVSYLPGGPHYRLWQREPLPFGWNIEVITDEQ